MEPWLAELHRSEDRLRAVIESSPLAIMEVDLERRVIRWNRAAERIFGWTREEMLGRPGTPMVPPSKQAEHEELVARVRAGESYTGYQTVRRRKDGTLFAVMMAAAPVQDVTGRVVSHVVVYNDVSEATQQEKRLQAVIDSSPLALVEFGLDTRVRLWNPAAVRIFGWSREEMLGRGHLPMAPPSKRAESEELFARVRAGESLNDYETVRQRRDGTLVEVSIAAAPIRDGSGQVVGNMVAYTDITDRKAQEERLQAVIDSSPLALVEFGLDTRVRLWNPAAVRIFGWSPSAPRGDNPVRALVRALVRAVVSRWGNITAAGGWGAAALAHRSSPSTGHTPHTRPERPPVDRSVRELSLELARNSSWGYVRIGGELRKLGIDVSATLLRNVLENCRKPWVTTVNLSSRAGRTSRRKSSAV